MSKALQLEILKIAESQVGVREEGDNTGVEVLKYMRSTWMPEESNRKGYAWCAAFVCWVVTEACNILNLKKDDIVYKGADAFGWEKWARKKGWEVLTENDLALPGDLVTFDFSHIGVVVEDNRDWVVTIEGNTNADGERDGDGVYKKKRSPRSLIRSIIRIPDIGDNKNERST